MKENLSKCPNCSHPFEKIKGSNIYIQYCVYCETSKMLADQLNNNKQNNIKNIFDNIGFTF